MKLEPLGPISRGAKQLLECLPAASVLHGDKGYTTDRLRGRVEADGTQRLWKVGELGEGPTLVLPGVKPAGYHAWIDAGRRSASVT